MTGGVNGVASLVHCSLDDYCDSRTDDCQYPPGARLGQVGPNRANHCSDLQFIELASWRAAVSKSLLIEVV